LHATVFQQINAKKSKFNFEVAYSRRIHTVINDLDNFKSYAAVIGSSYKLIEKEKLNLRLGIRLGYASLRIIRASNNVEVIADNNFYNTIGISQHTQNYFAAYQVSYSLLGNSAVHKLSGAKFFWMGYKLNIQPEINYYYSVREAHSLDLKFRLIFNDRFWLSFLSYKYAVNSSFDSDNGIKITDIELYGKTKDEKIKVGISYLFNGNGFTSGHSINLFYAYSFTKFDQLNVVNKMFF